MLRSTLVRLVLSVSLALAIVPLARATGFGGSDNPTRIPVPGSVYKAIVEDRTGTTVTLDRVTFDGEVHLSGDLGEGRVAVPFERIRSVLVEPGPDDGHVVLFITLRDGDPIRLIVEDDTPCYGHAAFGNYRIDIGKVRRVTVEGPLDLPREPPAEASPTTP